MWWFVSKKAHKSEKNELNKRIFKLRNEIMRLETDREFMRIDLQASGEMDKLGTGLYNTLIKSRDNEANRGIGKTAHAISLTKECNGILLCTDSKHASDIKKLHGIKTKGITSYRAEGNRTTPIVFDQDAIVNEMIKSINNNIRIIKIVKKYL